MNENAFKILDLLSRRGRPRNFNNIELALLYKNVRPITILKYNDIMDLLQYIPPVHHFKSFPHMQTGKE